MTITKSPDLGPEARQISDGEGSRETSSSDQSQERTYRGRATSSAHGVRRYFFSDPRRAALSVLGLIWLLDGALQFQPFMYGSGFIELLTGTGAGQPPWLHDSITWAATTLAQHQIVGNTLCALIQVLIGLGLLYRRTEKPALALSFVWTLVVWWFGEAFGMLFMTMASPLTGAPGAVLLYAIVGAILWPTPRAGGLLGVRGAKTVWAVVWLVTAWLWLEAPSSGANAVSDAINAAPSGMSWLSTVQYWVAGWTKGAGLPIAVVLALASAAIGIAVAAGWRPRVFLALAITLNVAYWVLGQGFGGIFQPGATDPNAGPLFVLFAIAIYPLTMPGSENLAGDRSASSIAIPTEEGA